MNIISEKKHDNAVVELDIEIPIEVVAIEYETVFNKIQKKAKIDGFRQGKAPMHIIEKKYKDIADEEVAENLARSTFYAAIEKKEFVPIVEPRISFDTIAIDEPFKYKAVFEVMPTVELGQYTKLDTEEETCKITDNDVKKEIDVVREKYADINVLENIDTQVKNGNLARIKVKRIDNIDEGEEDKVDFKEYSIIVGKSVDEYTIDKQLIGMKKDEEKKVTIKYPKDYYIKEFAGNKITYLVNLYEINSVALPDFNDEFVKKVGFESTDDMTTKTREYLEKYVKDKILGSVRSDLINKILEKSTFDIPESMVVNEMYSLFEKTMQRVGYKTDSIEQFAAALGLDPDEYRAKLREEAIKSIKSTLVLSEIAKKEDIQSDEEKYNELIDNISKHMGKTVEEVETLIEENKTKSSLENDIILEKAMDFIYNNANIKRFPAMELDAFIKKNIGKQQQN
ncbi:MAG: trigger factor [Leptospirales bacterium]|nr:trigger factor [Leptospirales bacterium]